MALLDGQRNVLSFYIKTLAYANYRAVLSEGSPRSLGALEPGKEGQVTVRRVCDALRACSGHECVMSGTDSKRIQDLIISKVVVVAPVHCYHGAVS